MCRYKRLFILRSRKKKLLLPFHYRLSVSLLKMTHTYFTCIKTDKNAFYIYKAIDKCLVVHVTNI